MTRIKTVITDVDGVLTDGRFVYTKDGKQSKTFGAHDADGVNMLKYAGINVIAISADKRGWPITMCRLNDMKIESHQVSESERIKFISDIVVRDPYSEVAFVGDGFYDIEAMKLCRVGFAPKNSLIDTASRAGFVVLPPNVKILPVSGGDGVMFYVAQMIIKEMYK